MGASFCIQTVQPKIICRKERVGLSNSIIGSGEYADQGTTESMFGLWNLSYSCEVRVNIEEGLNGCLMMFTRNHKRECIGAA